MDTYTLMTGKMIRAWRLVAIRGCSKSGGRGGISKERKREAKVEETK